MAQMAELKIDIGGGTVVEEGWVNLDPVHGEDEWKRYAQDVPWPTEDSSVDLLYAAHVMEHIPAGAPRIDVMNEAWRVLKPGCRFVIRVPLLIYPGSGEMMWTAVADPTHVSFWVKESFDYFDGTLEAAADYGIKLWDTLHFGMDRIAWEGTWVGVPLKQTT